MKTSMKVAMVIALIALCLFALGGVAFATTGQPGPTPPELGDPVGANVTPHGGYSSSTNYCLQCHSVHGYPTLPATGPNAVSGYALLSQGSVTDVCATCHSYQTGAVQPPEEPDFGGLMGTASSRSAYDTTTPASGHQIGGAGPALFASNWAYSWGFSGGPTGPSTDRVEDVSGTASDTDGGLYCASCHTPHGDFGQLMNSEWVYSGAASDPDGNGPLHGEAAVLPWANDTQIYWDDPATPAHSYAIMYLYQPSAGAAWQVCTDTSHGTCYYAQTYDAEGQLVSLYGFKLLSSSPNHQYPYPGTPPSGTLYADDVLRTGPKAGIRSYNTDIYNHDGALFCGTCHSRDVDDTMGGTYHNHPTGCESCHGNPANDPDSRDYPHTSSFAALLQDLPDALCINCHTELP